MTPKVTVVIPTHNRPAMLRDALASVCVQTWPEWEALVIDDGSEPAVDTAGLVAEFGSRIRVVRNRQPMKLAYVRDQGVQLAAGAYVTQLDDDDRLAPTALAEAMTIFTRHVDLEVLFLGVLGFGVNRENFDLNQQATLKGVLTRASAVSHEGLIHFDRERFSALLGAVPMPFQRAMMPCAVWHRVSALRLQAYQLDPTVTDQETARQLIQPPLRDSEWALYAAVSSRAALLDRPLYLQRCEGQGYVSLPAQRDGGTLLVTVPHENVPVSAKHFQHFSAEKLERAFELHFALEEVAFLDRRSPAVKLIRWVLENKYFILTHWGIRNRIYRLYKHFFLVSDERHCGRIFMRFRPRPVPQA